MLKLNHLTGFGSGAGAAAAGGDVTSYVFDGASHLQIPDHADFDLSGDMTIEAFIRLPDGTPATEATIYMQGTLSSSADQMKFYVLVDGSIRWHVRAASANVISVISNAALLSDNTWHHVAVCRDSDNYYLYVDGTDQTSSGSPDSDTPAALAEDVVIGVQHSGGQPFIGHLDELRVSDTARYPDGTGFTPTTTQFTSDANTLLLIHSGETYTGALTGETAQSCVALDGTGDYLSVADHADWNFGSSDFTTECWVKVVAFSSSEGLIANYDGDGDQRAWNMELNDANTFRFAYSTDGTGGGWTAVDRSFSFSTATWYHVAVCRDGNNLRHFVDGTQVGSTADVTGVTFHNSTDLLTIGSYLNGAGSLANLNGQLAEVRISDTARYTTGFTPQTTRHDSDANTLLLIHGDENGGGTAAFTDSGNTGHTVTPIGNAFLGNGGTFTDSGNTGHTVSENGQAQRETEQEFKFADDGVGYYFDGSGDYLSSADHADWQLGGGSGNFTIDFWYRPTNGSENSFFGQRADDNNRWMFWFDSGASAGATFRVVDSSSETILVKQGTNSGWSANTWYHVALIRGWSGNANDWVITRNGVVVATLTDSSSVPNLAAVLWIGDTTNQIAMKGYMDEIRISNTARWTTDFSGSLPTEQYNSDSNTKLLIHCGETKSGTTGSGATFTDSGNTGHTVTENGNAIEATGNFYKF